MEVLNVVLRWITLCMNASCYLLVKSLFSVGLSGSNVFFIAIIFLLLMKKKTVCVCIEWILSMNMEVKVD